MRHLPLLFGFLCVIFIPQSRGSAQESDSPGPWRLSGAGSAFYHGRSEIDRWQPGFLAGIRWNFLPTLHADLTLNRVRSQQLLSYACPDMLDYPCPDPEKKTGSWSLFSLGIGVNGKGKDWRPFLGVAYGQASEAIGHGAPSYSGPTLSGYLGLERRLEGSVGAFLEYRIHRQYWENDYEAVLKDVHIKHHEMVIGLSFTPRWRPDGFTESPSK